MSIEDQPTQQIRRPDAPAPLPGPLDLTTPTSEETPETGSTEVLSLDQLLDGPAGPPPAAPAAAPLTAATPTAAPSTVAPSTVAPAASTPFASTAPVASTPITTTAAPEAPRIGAVPVSSTQTGTDRGTSRLRGDAAAAWRGGLDRSRAWFTAGDNAVIAATVLIALLLLLAVAFF